MTDSTLHQLAATIAARRADVSSKSYTRQLLEGGPALCARKLGEEAIETIVATLEGDKTALTSEAADVLYHLLVLLECRQVAIDDVLAVLRARMGVSGLDEKAARTK